MFIKLIRVIKCDLCDLNDLSDLGDMGDLCDLSDLSDSLNYIKVALISQPSDQNEFLKIRIGLYSFTLLQIIIISFTLFIQ